MTDWKKELAEIDDEYLTGLTNKGIMKRAYKDKETASVKITETAEEAVLQVDNETVTLCIPLGQSKCTCPSRSICKHIILGILVLKESVCSDNHTSMGTQFIDDPEKNAITESSESIPSEQNGIIDLSDETLSGQRNTAELSDNTSIQERLWNEILSYPEKNLCKIMGTRHLTSFLDKAGKNLCPEIEESSVFTIRLPGQDTTVKLLSPLKYSSCTCHKKELCIHKAEAILWCKLKAGRLSLKDLDESRKKEISVDPEQVKSAASQMKDYLVS